MPQELSEMRQNIYLLQAKLKDIVNPFSSSFQNYEKLVNSLKAMSEMTEKYFTPDEESKYPAVTEQDMNAIEKQYNQLLTVCYEVSAAERSSANKDDKILALIEEITSFARRDLSSLQFVNADGKMTLPEIISQGRTFMVNIEQDALPQNNHEIDNRVPMHLEDENQGDLEGYFVPDGTFDFENSNINAALDKLSAKYRRFNTVLDKIRDRDISSFSDVNNEQPTFFYNISAAIKYKADDEFAEGEKASLSKKADDLQLNDKQKAEYVRTQLNIQLIDRRFKEELELLGFSENETEEIFETDDFNQFMNELATEMNQVAAIHEKYTNSNKWLGLKQGAEIGKRNAAVFVVARLLGKPEVMAESKPLVVMNNNKTVIGTFVANPAGINPYEVPTHQSEIKDFGVDKYDNPNVFDDISALQALDFICGNLDRQPGNMLMNFSTEDKKLCSLKGIGNAFSFGTRVPKADEVGFGSRWVAPSQMGVIGLGMAKSILALSEDGLSLALKGFGLNQEEISAAWQRTLIMKQEIAKGLEHYENVPNGQLDNGFLRVVPETTWKEYKLSTIAEMGDNQFKTISNMSQIIKDHEATVENEKKLAEENKIEKELDNNIKETLQAKPIGNGLLNIANIGVPRSPSFKIATTEAGVLPQVAGTKTVRYGIEFEVDGEAQRGFFTPLILVNERKETNRIMDDVVSIYGEYEKELEQMRHYFIEEPGLRDTLWNIYSDYQKVPLEDMGFSKERARELRADEKFNNIIKDMHTRFDMSKHNLEDYREFGVDEGSSIDQRNVAMTNVAELCGAPELLARSYNVQLQEGNRIVDGVYMDTADGVDIFRLKKDDPILDYDDKAFDNGEGLKSLAELQILDYLCMNMDRHEGNMLYKFSEGPEPKLIGVVGIDNDYSFGTKDPNKDSAYFVTAIDNIKVISSRMAENILKINPEQLAQTLRGQKIGNNEIIAAQERLGRLQARISNGKIKTVADDKWSEYTLGMLAGDKDNNIFSRVQNHTKQLRDSAKKAREKNEPYNDNLKPIEYKKVKKVDEFDKEVVINNTEKKAYIEKAVEDLKKELKAKAEAEKKANADFIVSIENHVNSQPAVELRSDADLFKDTSMVVNTAYKLLDDADPFYIHSSRQFKDLKKKAKEMRDYIKTIENRAENQGKPTAEEKAYLAQGLKDLDTKVSEYVTYKVNTVDGNENRFNDLENKRVYAVRSTGSMAKSVSDSFERQEEVKRYRNNSNEILTDHLAELTSSIKRAKGDKLKELVAEKLYYKVLQKAGNDIVGKMHMALSEKAVSSGIKQIKDSPAFKELFNADQEDVIRMSDDEMDDKLYTKYIQEMAAHAKKQKAPENNNNIQQPQNVNGGPLAH